MLLFIWRKKLLTYSKKALSFNFYKPAPCTRVGRAVARVASRASQKRGAESGVIWQLASSLRLYTLGTTSIEPY